MNTTKQIFKMLALALILTQVVACSQSLPKNNADSKMTDYAYIPTSTDGSVLTDYNLESF